MKNEKGFGIIEIVILIGLVTGMAYFLISQQQAKIKAKHRTDFDHDLNNIVNIVYQALSNPYHCSATVAGVLVGSIPSSDPMPTVGGIALAVKGEVVGGSLPAIRLATEQTNWPETPASTNFSAFGVLFNAGEEVYPGFEIGKIHVANDRVNDFIRIEFKYTAQKQAIISGRSLNRDFILSARKIGTTITECRIKVPDQILAQGCTKLGSGSTWNLLTKKCDIPITSYYLKSTDLYPLYDDGNGAYINVSPIAAPLTSSCTCPTAACVTDGHNCCLPATCVGFYIPRPSPPVRTQFLTEDPPVAGSSAGMCTFTSRCLAQPEVGLIK